MQNLPPPQPLTSYGDSGEGWKRWRQRWENYVIGSGLSSKPGTIQCAAFLTIIGEEALEIYNTFTWETPGDEKNLEKVIQKFDTYFLPKVNVTFERHVFNTRQQVENESLDDYIKALRILAKSCEYGDLLDGILKDRLIAGLRDDSLREKLLEKSDSSFDEAIRIIKIVEANRKQARDYSTKHRYNEDSAITAETLQLKTKPRQPTGYKYNAEKYQHTRGQREYNTQSQQVYKGFQKEFQCTNCGLKHHKRNCPAYGAECYLCHKPNHFARMCRTGRNISKAQPQRGRYQSVLQVNENRETETENEQSLFIGALECASLSNSKTDNQWEETLHINKLPVKFKLDTGAMCNVLNKKVYDRLTAYPLKKSNIKLTSYTKQIISPLGETTLPCLYKNVKYDVNFQVIQGDYASIIGRDDCVRLQLVTRTTANVSSLDTIPVPLEGILKDFEDLFCGVGKLPGEYKIEVDPLVSPVVHAPRRVPHSLKKQFKEELQHLESEGIIKKVPQNEPSEWVNSLVVVPKPKGGVRICIDPKDLNRAIKREFHPLTTVHDVITQIDGAKYFSVLDAKSAFHQIVVENESSKLLTFNTEFGRYRYTRLPYGIKSASEIFQRRVQEIIEGLPGVAAGMDDFLVWAKTDNEHDERVKNLLLRLRQNNLKLNRNKCEFKKSKVTFHGHIFTPEGVKPIDSRCATIRNMPVPTSKDELKRFLGMITYVGRFIPNLSRETAPLRELLKREAVWQWLPEHEHSYQKLKTFLITPPVLTFYDPTAELVLQVDASSQGLGAALIQGGKPVEYASRALTKAEQAYSQIEKELLAILYGCNKFQEYVVGRDIIVETDHKPLEHIMRKPLYLAPLRLQRMLMQLQRYSGLNVIYKKGTEMFIADLLSRTTTGMSADTQECEASNEFQIDLLNILPMSQKKLSEMIHETTLDPVLTDLKETLCSGWPDSKSKIKESLKPYWTFRDEITVVNDLVFKGNKIIVPTTLRKAMLQKLHESHQGIVRTKQRARDIFFWHGMNQEIEQLVGSCETCGQFQRANQKEPMLLRQIPNRPWEMVAMDLFVLNNRTFLLCVDFYSKFPEMVLLNQLTSATVITASKSIFARHGVPVKVYTDQGPQFASAEFSHFANDWDFEHFFSSPLYPQSNGQIERTVQTVKNMLKKAKDPYYALLEYRNTPLAILNASPAQLLMSRRLRSLVPTSCKLLEPQVQTDIPDKLSIRQQTQAKYYNRSTKPLPLLKTGDKVFFRHRSWTPGTVLRPEAYRSYLVRTPTGAVYQRTRAHLRQRNSPPELLDSNLAYAPLHREGIGTNYVNSSITATDGVNSATTTGRGRVDTDCVNRATTTRSGRIIKPPNRLNL